jgi:hypothetical protein
VTLEFLAFFVEGYTSADNENFHLLRFKEDIETFACWLIEEIFTSEDESNYELEYLVKTGWGLGKNFQAKILGYFKEFLSSHWTRVGTDTLTEVVNCLYICDQETISDILIDFIEKNILIPLAPPNNDSHKGDLDPQPDFPIMGEDLLKKNGIE